MKVKDLITLLQNFDPETQIVKRDEDAESPDCIDLQPLIRWRQKKELIRFADNIEFIDDVFLMIE